MKYLIPLFVILFAQLAAAQSQMEMNQQAGTELEQADKKLNTVYQQLIRERKGEKVFIQNLRKAQRAWLGYAEAHLECTFPLEEGENPRQKYGSIYPMEYAYAKKSLIDARLKQLNELLPGHDPTGE